MRLLSLIINWVIGVVFLLLAVVLLFSLPASSIPCVLLALIFLPPVRNWVHEKTGRLFPRKPRRIVIFVLIVSIVVVAAFEGAREDEKRAAIALQQKIDRFHEQKDTIVDSITVAISREDYKAAIAQANRYAFAADSELVALKRTAEQEQTKKRNDARRAQILAQLKTIPAREYAKNKTMYAELVKLTPGNETYQSKYEHYSAKLAEKEKTERIARERKARKAREAAARTEQIEAQFSAWDGAHRNLTKVIKASMNDPGSFKHAKTVYWDMGDHLIVQETFRGKNAFGGVVMNTVKAKVSLNGTVLEVIDQW